jgi:hypothetical protein
MMIKRWTGDPEFENIVLFTDEDQEGDGDPEFDNIVLFTDDDQEGDGDP